MQNNFEQRVAGLQRRFHRRGRARLLATLAATLVIPPSISMTGNAQPSAATHRVIPQTKALAKPGAKDAPRSLAAPANVAEAAQLPGPPAAAPPPQWPVNNAAQQATVTWTAQGLSIDAQNSSLRQILDSVQSQIGVKVQGFDKDERVFGSYGPGQPREVLSQLLEGTDYNVLMVGNREKGVPQQIQLSARPSGGPQPNAPVAPGDTYEPPVAPYEPPQPLPKPPPAPPNQAPRTPQQIMQEMQQRELMMREQQMQQQQQEEQQQGQQPQ